MVVLTPIRTAQKDSHWLGDNRKETRKWRTQRTKLDWTNVRVCFLVRHGQSNGGHTKEGEEEIEPKDREWWSLLSNDSMIITLFSCLIIHIPLFLSHNWTCYLFPVHKTFASRISSSTPSNRFDWIIEFRRRAGSWKQFPSLSVSRRRFILPFQRNSCCSSNQNMHSIFQSFSSFWRES